jgi:hypothetical protein
MTNVFLDQVEAEERVEKQRGQGGDLRIRIAQLQRVLRFMKHEDYQAFLQERQKQDQSRYRDMIRAETFDAFKAGKVFGRIEVIEDLRASDRRLQQELDRCTKAIQRQETL